MDTGPGEPLPTSLPDFDAILAECAPLPDPDPESLSGYHHDDITETMVEETYVVCDVLGSRISVELLQQLIRDARLQIAVSLH